jgi:small-conductance mechanosensitive channel
LKQLTDVYQRWLGVIDAREREVLHQLLRCIALLLTAVLAALIAIRIARAYLASKRDARHSHQAMTLTRAIIWAVAAGLCTMVFFGPPTEVSTLVGLTTAGLTVALKDYIAAIFGWFALIGKNGVHIGDWVEIEGVGGEVVDIGLFRTELLELGNWTNTGRPTGRRVSFMNKYAIEHHFFNFSTTGQWLWDELHMTLPSSDHAYEDAQKVLEIVEAETRADSEAAEQNWTAARPKSAAKDSQPFTARPTVDLRPSVTGLEVYVRYVTRAPQRYQTKSRLFDAVFKRLKARAASV